MSIESLPRILSIRFTANILTLLFMASTTSAQTSKVAEKTSPSLSWVMQDSGTTASLRGIYSVDNKIAWASGTAGTILKTTDGGSHWTQCSIPPDGQSLDFRGVQAFDATTAIVMASGPGEKSRLYNTTDGCKTWKLLFKNPDAPDGFFDSFFADWYLESGNPKWTGSLLGDPVGGRFVIFDTLDSGTRWTLRKNDALALNTINVSAFAASNSLFPEDQNKAHEEHIFASGGKSGAILWMEKTPELTWNKIALPLMYGTDSSGVFSIASHTDSEPFRNVVALRETIVAVGGDYQKPDESAGTAAWSTDLGLHWTAAIKSPHGYRSSVSWSEELAAWITAGTNGSDISRDDGKTWQLIDNGNWNALSLPFVVGPKGRIARLAGAEPK